MLIVYLLSSMCSSVLAYVWHRMLFFHSDLPLTHWTCWKWSPYKHSVCPSVRPSVRPLVRSPVLPLSVYECKVNSSYFRVSLVPRKVTVTEIKMLLFLFKMKGIVRHLHLNKFIINQTYNTQRFWYVSSAEKDENRGCRELVAGMPR